MADLWSEFSFSVCRFLKNKKQTKRLKCMCSLVFRVRMFRIFFSLTQEKALFFPQGVRAPPFSLGSGQKLSHAPCVHPCCVFFFFCAFVWFHCSGVSVTLDLCVNEGGRREAVECCNHLTHTHLSCPFVPRPRPRQREPFVECAVWMERQSVTQTAVGTHLLALICFLCWDQFVRVSVWSEPWSRPATAIHRLSVVRGDWQIVGAFRLHS